ncbi:MAG: hypothetical protein AUI47_06910 [Acidobacteria bacterium 13_1_40CM_2_68_5]|nr:MAG: hypothetical protein AUI47_06910 [Acidobacteria bacterium 13_1_40CM_2_68_5]
MRRSRLIPGLILGMLMTASTAMPALCVDLTVAGIEVNQATQTPTNTITLVAERSTAVRVTIGVTGASAAVTGVTGRLHVFVDGVEITPVAGLLPINAPFTAPLAPQRANENDTLNFELLAPTGISVSTNVDFHVDINPVAGETDTTNNSGEVNDLSFECRATPHLFFTRINFAGHGLPALSTVQAGTGDAFVRGILPVNDGDPLLYRQGLFPTLTFNQDDNNNGILDGCPGAESDVLLSLLESCRQLIVSNGFGTDDRTFLFGFINGNPISGNGCASVGGRVSYGNTEAIRYQRSYAHELTHNFGFSHNGSFLNQVGWDVGARLPNNPAGNNTSGRVKPTSLFDIQVPGQLTNSAYIKTGLPDGYNGLLGHPTLACGGLDFSSQVLVVQGIFNSQGTGLIQLKPVFRYPWPSRPTPPPPPPDPLVPRVFPFQVQVVDANQNVISVPFDPTVADDAIDEVEGPGTFEVMIPLAGPANSLEITDASGATMFGGFVRSATPPTVRVRSPQGGATLEGPTKIMWDVVDPDSSPSELMFQAAYSPDKGQSFVPIGVDLTTNELDFDPSSVQESAGGGLIRIFASDGLNTSFIDVPGLTVRAPLARQICIGSTLGEAGQRVTVPITLDNGLGVAGFQVDVGFDPSLLNPAGVRLGADTAAATGWTINSAMVGFGVLRVLGHSNPPAGLGAGPKEVALVDFDIAATAPIGPMTPFRLANCVLSDPNGLQIPCNSCPQPGQVVVRPAGSFSFRPINSPVGVDQFDPLPFPSTVEALTFTNTLATGYNGTASMSVGPVCAGTLQPASLPFFSGVGNGTFSIGCCLDPLLPMTRTPLKLQATDAAISISGSSAPFNGVAKADVNADNAVNILDVVRAINFSLNLPVSSPPPVTFQRWAANMLDQNCSVDALINVLDIVRIRNKALGRPPLCPCSVGGVGVLTEQAAVLASPVTPFSISLEKAGARDYLVKVHGAVDLSGLQLELKAAGPKATVSLEGLTAGRNWQATTTLDQGVLKIVAFSNAAAGVSGDGAVLRITGGGSPHLGSAVAADSEGREIPVRSAP